MTVKRVLIASSDPQLLIWLDDRLRWTYIVEMALNNDEVLSKLQAQPFAALLADWALVRPEAVATARRLSPNMHVISIWPDDVAHLDRVVSYLKALQRLSQAKLTATAHTDTTAPV